MPRKQPHPKFVEYMHFIASHDNYQGMPDLLKDDGEIQWETPSNRLSGKFKDSHAKRLMWWREKAIKVGIDPTSFQWISRTAKLIHPTKEKPCAVCGLIMDLRYAYPSSVLLIRIHRLRYIDEAFLLDPNEHILELVSRLVNTYGDRVFNDLPQLLRTHEIAVPSLPASLDEWLLWIEKAYIPLEPKILSPGAMSNAPDRFDGFHTYNRCCRSGEDKGRSRINLASYVTDRRVFEYWNQGDWIAADRLMGQIRSILRGEICLNGHPGPCSADHIGPLSLGFEHRPEFQLLCASCNSAKNNRMMFSDVVHLREIENLGEEVISWHSKALWDARKLDVCDEETALRLSKLLRDNRHNVLSIFRKIADAGYFTFLATFLELNFANYDVTFDNLRVENHITNFDKMIHIPRLTLCAEEQKARRCRIAFASLYEYFTIETRNLYLISSQEIEGTIAEALRLLQQSPSDIKDLDHEIKTILSPDYSGDIDYGFRTIVNQIPSLELQSENFSKAREEISKAINIIANHLSQMWNDERYIRFYQSQFYSHRARENR